MGATEDIDEWGYWEKGLTKEEYFRKYPRNKQDEEEYGSQ